MDDVIAGARIRALEDALVDTIEYLKRMPIAPVTAAQIRAAQAVLENDMTFKPLVGERYTPSGFLVVGIEIVGAEATLRTTVRPGDGERLVEMLSRGLTITLMSK